MIKKPVILSNRTLKNCILNSSVGFLTQVSVECEKCLKFKRRFIKRTKSHLDRLEFVVCQMSDELSRSKTLRRVGVLKERGMIEKDKKKGGRSSDENLMSAVTI